MDETLGTIRSFDEVGPLRSRAGYDEVNPGSIIPDGAQTRGSRSSTGSVDPASGSSDAGESCTAHGQRRGGSPGSYTVGALGKRCGPIPDVPVNVEAIQAEAVRRAQEVAQAELDRRWQQQRSDVEAEKAAWAADFQRQLASQMDIVQQKIREMEEARNLDQATIRTLQNVQRTRSRNIPTTSPQVQGTQATASTDSATLSRTEPVRMAMYPESSGVSMGGGDGKLDKSISDLTAAQLRATLQPMTETKYAKTETTSKVVTTNASRTTAQKSGSKSTEPTRSGSRKPSCRRTSDKKHSGRRGGDPSDDSSSSGSSDSGSSDDDSDSSSGGSPPQATTTTTLGGTTLTFRPYVSSSTLEDFDEDAQLPARRRWWERFLNLTVQGGWSDRTKVYELKLKMPPAVRNWRGQLSKRSRRDWTRLSKLFKREYCKSKLSEAERYYTMTQRKGEKALAFLYRLNLAAERAGVFFRKSSRKLEQHMRQFVRNLSDESLKETLQSHRFKKNQRDQLNSDCPQVKGMDGGLTMIQKTRNGKLQGCMVQLQLTLSSHRQIKVSGLGGVPTYISSSTQVKVTLGHRVVYVLDLWVTNIGEDVDVLLGMDFMFSAGVRLCIREGLVILPDEESILMYGEVVQRRQGLDLPIKAPTGLHLRSGESATVRIRYGQSNPETDVVWAGRGDRWVTQILYGPQIWTTAVKVVNISDRDLWIDAGTPVARIVEYGHFPTAGRFDEEPPAVQTRSYQWPTKLLMRPRSDTEAVRMVHLQDRPMSTPEVGFDYSEPATAEKQAPGREVSGGPEDGTSEYDEGSSRSPVSNSGSEGVERSQRLNPIPNNTDEEYQASGGVAEESTLQDEPARKDEDPETPSVIAMGHTRREARIGVRPLYAGEFGGTRFGASCVPARRE
ncbi:hypothetical protein PR003_g20539 [Phytophthora rubi]|uniref:Retrotransposon gag domain-containing protein n=1 Tax=Phytophthora rubi TaxID=129364 RepID=A0A6A4DJ06_9STRA|nr:hypothetical protein PR003_g20539 [Phytophthora rubi]